MARDVIVVGASAGGVESLRVFLRALSQDLPASVLIVLHLPASGASMLPTILSRVGTLSVMAAEERNDLRHGSALVAPPDYHLMVADNHAVLTRGPRENGHRPAIDVLFRSAARACGSRVIGVMLSGALDDGTAGMVAIRQRGGLVLAQDPSEATYPSMPTSVIKNVGADHVASAARLGALVDQLSRTNGATPPPQQPSDLLEVEVDMAEMKHKPLPPEDRPDRPGRFSCPDCHGVLYEIDDGGLLRFRCRVGHAWSSLGLLVEQSETLDTALWMALRSLEEKAALSRQLAERAAERGNVLTRQRFLERAEEASQSATVIKRLLEQPISAIPQADLEEDSPEEEHAERR